MTKSKPVKWSRKQKVAEVYRLRKAGVSTRHIVAQLAQRGVMLSEASVRNYFREACDAADVARKAAADDPGEDKAGVPVDVPAAPVEAAGGTALEQTRAMLSDARRMAAEARAEGNHSAAQKFMRDAAGLAAIVAREEKRLGGDAETIVLSRPELERAWADLQERVKHLAGVPLTCSECGRALRIREVTKGEV